MRYNHQRYQSGNDPNEDLAKFGYMLKMKVAFLKNIFSIFLATSKKNKSRISQTFSYMFGYKLKMKVELKNSFVYVLLQAPNESRILGTFSIFLANILEPYTENLHII